MDKYSAYRIKITEPTDKSRIAPYESITKLILNVPFTNLSHVPESQIAVKRMRPLIWMGGAIGSTLGKAVFTINGRRDFHAGRS